MDAVVLALASAALFGSMTVALRFALARVPDAEAGALLTILAALAVTLPVRRRGRARARRRLAVPARRRARSRRLAAPLHARGPRRGPVADVGDGRHGAALLGRDRARAARRAGEGGRDRRRGPDRRRRDRARARAGPAGAREVDRARVRARRDDHLRRPRQPRPAPLAGHRRRAGARGGRDARSPAGSPSPSGCSSRGAGCRRRGLARVRPGRRSASASPTSASSRPTTAAASRSSRRSSRPSRSGASASRRSCSAGTSSSARASSPAPRSWSRAESDRRLSLDLIDHAQIF